MDTPEPKPNVAASLITIHAVITRGLTVSTESVISFLKEPPPSASLLEGFLKYCQALVATLHGHHLAEDDLSFPYFKKMLPRLPVGLLTQQHKEMIPILENIKSSIESCEKKEGLPQALKGLQTGLNTIQAMWKPHIEIEEKHLTIEELETLLPPEEHLKLIRLFGEHSQKHSQPAFLTAPFILYNLPPEARAEMAKGMPAEVTENLVPIIWKEQWAPMLPYLLA